MRSLAGLPARARGQPVTLEWIESVSMPIPECGCQVWLMHTDQKGYGKINNGRGHTIAAHKAAYELRYGPTPSGMQLDHLCRVRSCVNPDHLEPVTSAENRRRGVQGILYRPPTHCRNGHAFGAENPASGKGGMCLICRRAATKKWNDIQNGARKKYWGPEERSARSRICAAVRWGKPIDPSDLARIGK